MGPQELIDDLCSFDCERVAAARDDLARRLRDRRCNALAIRNQQIFASSSSTPSGIAIFEGS
jgi:hypothetical protein